MRTFSLKGGDITRDWLVIDAADQILGRLATRIASLLRGKHKPTYSPHLEMGDYVIVVNAARVRVSGKKLSDLLSPLGLSRRTEERYAGRADGHQAHAGHRDGGARYAPP